MQGSQSVVPRPEAAWAPPGNYLEIQIIRLNNSEPTISETLGQGSAICIIKNPPDNFYVQ